MNSDKNSDSRRTLIQLISELCEDRLTPERLAELESLLLSDPEALAEFVAYLDIHAGLNWEFSAKRESMLPVADVSEVDAVLDTSLAETDTARHTEITPRRRSRWLRHPMTSAYAVAFVVTAAVLLVMALIPITPREDEQVVSERKLAEPVAQIDRTSNARWAKGNGGAKGSKMSNGRRLRPDDELSLESGFAEIAFYNGTTLVLEGPASLRIDTDKRTRLDYGRLRAHVPPKAVGFVVDTPHQTVTDLGTEFGVYVEKLGVSEVHVFTGKVETLSKDTPDAEPISLVADQSIRFEPQGGAAETGVANSSRFVKTLPLPAPLHQWTFNDGTPRDTVGTADGTLNGGAQVVAGRLVLDGIDDYMSSAPIEKPIVAKTLVAWVELANLDQRSGSALTLEDSPRGDKFDAIVFGELHPRQWVAGSESYSRSLMRDQPAAIESAGASREMMLAIVYSPSNTISVYRNGQRISRYEQGTMQNYAAKQAHALIGLRHHIVARFGGTPTGNDGYLAAEINEARIYDQPLSARQIHEMYEAGPESAASADSKQNHKDSSTNQPQATGENDQ